MRICKFLTAVILSFASSLIYAQQAMPAMPSISSSDGPVMPRITAPTMGKKYYTPGTVSTNISNKTVHNQNVPAAEKNNSTSSTKKNEEVLKQILGDVSSSRLTASDVAGLGNDGLFTGIYGLLGNDKNLYTASSGSVNNDILLQTIMNQLDELKNEAKKTKESVENITNLPVTHATSSQKHEYEPQILRFYVNGYNILETMRTVYFSKKENDGSFLLTGDRRYTSDNKNREETFYMLFKADGNCGTSAGYFVEPQVIQDYKNEYSFLYQLTMKPELKAEKTGNLVSVKYVSADWNMDLLLDIGDL